tara:strand:- start:9887 stop:10396 length:510 start_codon:yes stop_codon:yes gene_type:complete
MIFNFKKHNTDLYNTLLLLSRNIFFYDKINLKDTFETRIYLIFIHFSIFLLIFKRRGEKFSQKKYDSLFFCIENNLRELGFGDVSVNKKMKDFNKIFYDILLKLNQSQNSFNINKELVLNYFVDLKELNLKKYQLFEDYFLKFYDFCFELNSENMIKDALKFKDYNGST